MLHAHSVKTFQARFGAQVATGKDELNAHGQGEGWYGCAPPDIVVFARSTEDVRDAVLLAAEHKLAVIPYGAGTSLEGHVNAIHGGVCIDTRGLDQILEVNPHDFDCRVQAGVTRKALEAHLREYGLFFPPDPGADATLGGMAATRASGTNSVRYGTMRDGVMGLEVVLSDGHRLTTGGRARKSAAGYDLTALFLGSEGTLGVITELRLRLHPLPETMVAAVCQYSNIQAAVESVVALQQALVPVARVELLDALQMEACIRYSRLTGLDAQPTLFFEFHGSAEEVQAHVATTEALAKASGGTAFQWAKTPEARRKLWQARHDAYHAARAWIPGARVMVTDACVPLSALAGCIEATVQDLAAHDLTAPIVGHVGDGNFHLAILIPPDDDATLERARRVVERLNTQALAAEGTCTGEHGIGLGKRRWLRTEHAEGWSVMASLKRALDPHNRMNPGKIFIQDPGGNT